MTVMHTKNCPVCGEEKFSAFLSCIDYLVSEEKFSVIKCSNCHFAFTQDFPSEDKIGKYYEATDYVSHSDTHRGIINKLYHLVRKRSLKSKVKLVKNESKKTSGELLDIGTGTGYFLDKMQSAGWDVTGIEKSETTRNQAKKRFNIDCYDSEYLFQLPKESKDIITMWHVLEHIEKLNETMSQIHSVLKQNGMAIIALPNRKSVDAKHYQQNWAAYDVPRHLWHFSPSDFSLLAEKHNFELAKMKPMHFDGFYISMLSEKNAGTICSSFVGLTKGAFFFLRSLTSTKKCSSIIYILKKK